MAAWLKYPLHKFMEEFCLALCELNTPQATEAFDCLSNGKAISSGNDRVRAAFAILTQSKNLPVSEVERLRKACFAS